MKTVIYGGTYNPPHKGHIRALQSAIDALCPDRVILIPTAEPPHKVMEDNSASADDRLKMTRLAVSGFENVTVSDIELNRGGKSYTVDTLEELKKQYPDDEFILLMGTDMLVQFETWRRFEDIFALAALGVFVRGDGEDSMISDAVEKLKSKYGARIQLIKNDPIEISSSDIREMLPKRQGKEFLDDKVYSYIIKNKLYNSQPDYTWLRIKTYARLKPKRIPHVAGTEQEAVRLAEKWGADVDKAREAAILHDITKKDSFEEQLIMCDKYGIVLDVEEQKSGKLLHSKTGAAIAKYEFGADDEIYNAIFWHTTGRENMTLLEKIIYLADYMEPTRNFDGVEPLRELAYTDLDKAILLGLEMSIEDISARGIIPHARTRNAAEWLRKSIGERK